MLIGSSAMTGEGSGPGLASSSAPPARSADFPVCGFWGLSSPQRQAYAKRRLKTAAAPSFLSHIQIANQQTRRDRTDQAKQCVQNQGHVAGLQYAKSAHEETAEGSKLERRASGRSWLRRQNFGVFGF